MRPQSVIIVTGGLASSIGTKTLKNLVDLVRDQGKNPILVLGPDGDEFITAVGDLESCEIVFDPNFDSNSDDNFFSGVKAGLHATRGPTFLLPLESSAPSPKDWVLLERSLLAPSAKSIDLLVALSQSVMLSLITAKGLTSLRALPSSASWTRITQAGTIRIGAVLNESACLEIVPVP